MNRWNQIFRITITCCLLLPAILGCVDMEVAHRLGQPQTQIETLTLAVGTVGMMKIIENEFDQYENYKQRNSLGFVKCVQDILLEPRYYQASFLG